MSVAVSVAVAASVVVVVGGETLTRNAELLVPMTNLRRTAKRLRGSAQLVESSRQAQTATLLLHHAVDKTTNATFSTVDNQQWYANAPARKDKKKRREG